MSNRRNEAHFSQGTKADTVRVSVTLNREDYSQIREIAKGKRVSIAWVVRDAIAGYLDASVPLFSRKTRRESL